MIADPRRIGDLYEVAEMLDTLFNGEERGDYRMVGFTLMLFPWGEPVRDRVNYISNVSRDEAIDLLREQLRYFEDGGD